MILVVPASAIQRSLINTHTHTHTHIKRYYPEIKKEILPVVTTWMDHEVITLSERNQGFSCGSAGKESACNAGDLGLIHRLGRSPGRKTNIMWPHFYMESWEKKKNSPQSQIDR